MRVLYLTMNPNRTSTTVPTEGWFRVLRERGLQPVLVSNQAGDFHAWSAAQGIPSYHVPLPYPNPRPLPLLATLFRLWRIARRHRIELIHSNEHDVYPIAQYLARLLRVPIALSVHFTMSAGYSAWAFRARRRPDRIFFISKGSLAACRPGIDAVIPESHWRLLYNGIDLERFHPDAAARTAFRTAHGLTGKVAIGVACALRPRKQLEHLFKAAAAVDAPDLRVVVAGAAVAGDEAYAADLMKLGRQLLGDRLIHLGHLDDLRAFYCGLDLFVNTSQEEACSISVIEAMASGTPVLGYPSTSVDEQILPNGGEIVGQDAIPDLAAALTQWVSDRPRLAHARDEARRRAEEMFDIRPLSEQLWSEYLQMRRQTLTT